MHQQKYCCPEAQHKITPCSPVHNSDMTLINISSLSVYSQSTREQFLIATKYRDDSTKKMPPLEESKLALKPDI